MPISMESYALQDGSQDPRPSFQINKNPKNISRNYEHDENKKSI